jgi:hypothetical protein
MFQRPEVPTKRSVPSFMILAVLLMVFLGVSIHNCSQKQLANEIQISNVVITEFSRVHVEVHYIIQNLSNLDREPELMLNVYDSKGDLLTSALFSIKIPAGKKQEMLKIIDKLIRPLDVGEKPGKAVLTVYQRKVL